jgi:hypothetical protein
MKRRILLALAVLGMPRPAPAQQPSTPPATPPWRGSGPPRTTAERDARHRWLEENWDSLPPDERRQAEERFRRGMGPQGPSTEEMRQRWQGMTPGQRRELMFGPPSSMRHGPGGGRMGPPPAAPRPPQSPPQ